MGDRPILAVDGEGLSSQTGLIALCGYSTKDGSLSLVNKSWYKGRLLPQLVLGTLWRWGVGHDVVIYASGYDAAQIFGGLIGLFKAHPDHRVRLKASLILSGHPTWITAYYEDGQEVVQVRLLVHYIPGKLLRLCRYNRSTKGVKDDDRVVIYDIFSYFGCSFEKAIDGLKIEAPRETRENISRGKRARVDFSTWELSDIVRYSQDECLMLARLFAELKRMFAEEGFKAQRWHGPGAQAKEALAKRTGIRPRRWARPKWSSDVDDAVRRGYIGGHVQLLRMGSFPTAYYYDIRSAYPSIISELPLPKSWSPKREDTYTPGKIMALWRVSWDIPYREQSITGPFPFRDIDGSICYPLRGEGWYWSAEVEAGIRFIQKFRGRYSIAEGLVWEDSGIRPFKVLVHDLYQRRTELKKQGDTRQLVYKLVLNSLYGVMAQTVGKAPLQNIAYAGLITGGVRARMLEVLTDHWADIISFATDAVITRRPLNFPLGAGLGEWEGKELSGLFILQPGFMVADQPDYIRSRGVVSETFLEEMRRLERDWRDYGCIEDMHLTCRHRFMLSIKQGIRSRDKDRAIGTFHEIEKIIRPLSKSKHEASAVKTFLERRKLSGDFFETEERYCNLFTRFAVAGLSARMEDKVATIYIIHSDGSIESRNLSYEQTERLNEEGFSALWFDEKERAIPTRWYKRA